MEWFRVLMPNTSDRDVIVCHECLIQYKPTLLNRVFGASQTCAKCGASDVKR